MTAVTPGAAAVETMTAIVQDEYGTAPEDVLRLAEIARPAIAADEIPAWCAPSFGAEDPRGVQRCSPRSCGPS